MTESDCTAQEEEIVSHPLEHLGVVEWTGIRESWKKRRPPDCFEQIRSDGSDRTVDGYVQIRSRFGRH